MIITSTLDTVGGPLALTRAPSEAKSTALREVEEAARKLVEKLGVNIVIGADLDYKDITFGDSGSMLTVTVKGTVVVVGG